MSDNLKNVANRIKEANSLLFSVKEPSVIEAEQMADVILSKPLSEHALMLEVIKDRMIKSYNNSIKIIEDL